MQHHHCCSSPGSWYYHEVLMCCYWCFDGNCNYGYPLPLESCCNLATSVGGNGSGERENRKKSKKREKLRSSQKSLILILTSKNGKLKSMRHARLLTAPNLLLWMLPSVLPSHRAQEKIKGKDVRQMCGSFRQIGTGISVDVAVALSVSCICTRARVSPSFP